MYKVHKPARLKKYARIVLALFMVSVLNVSMQLPAHAAMKMQMQQSTMQQMSECNCPPVVCDSVLALGNQSVDGVVSIQTVYVRSSTLLEVLDQNSGLLNQIQHTNRLFLNVSQAAPPALLIKTLLLI